MEELFFKSHSWGLIGKFLSVYMVLYLINIVLLTLFNLFLFDLYLAGVIVMILVSYLGYILNKRYVWIKIRD